jgi:hypothetical protein
MAEEADAATPAARAANERAALSSMYEAHHAKLQQEDEDARAEKQRRRDAELAKQENIRKEAARVAEARRIDAIRDKETRDRQSEAFAQSLIKKEIIGIMAGAHPDEIVEVHRRVCKEGLKNTPFAWEANLKALRAEQKS